jgi:hypothetical protein
MRIIPQVDLLVAEMMAISGIATLGTRGNFRDNDERHHRHVFNAFDFVAFGFP